MGKAVQQSGVEPWRETLRASLSLAKWGGGKVILVEIADPAEAALLNDELTRMNIRVGATPWNGVDVVIRIGGAYPEIANGQRAWWRSDSNVTLAVVPPELARRLAQEAPDFYSWLAARVSLAARPSADFARPQVTENLSQPELFKILVRDLEWSLAVLDKLTVIEDRTGLYTGSIVSAATLGADRLSTLSDTAAHTACDVLPLLLGAPAASETESRATFERVRRILEHASPGLGVEFDRQFEQPLPTP